MKEKAWQMWNQHPKEHISSVLKGNIKVDQQSNKGERLWKQLKKRKWENEGVFRPRIAKVSDKPFSSSKTHV